MTLQEKVLDIKKKLRLNMNGVASTRMREAGIGYKLNFGVGLPQLKDRASETGKDPELAVELWKENIRECKILATMVMPADQVLPEVIDIWMEQTPTQEIAEQAAFNLYQYLPYAPEKAYTWIASDKDLYQLCGFHILSRLFMNGQEPNERGINEFIDQALAALQGESIAVRKAAMASVQRFAELGLVYQRLAKSAIKTINLEFL